MAALFCDHLYPSPHTGGLFCRSTTCYHTGTRHLSVAALCNITFLTGLPTRLSHFCNGNTLLMSHESQNREDCKSSYHTGATVQ